MTKQIVQHQTLTIQTVIYEQKMYLRVKIDNDVIDIPYKEAGRLSRTFS